MIAILPVRRMNIIHCVFTRRIHRMDKKARPVWDKNISDFLDVDKHEECDLEAGVRIDKLIFWIGSHGTDSDGNEQPARRRLFATEIVKNEDGSFELKMHGKPYKHLLDDFFDDTRLKKFEKGGGCAD